MLKLYIHSSSEKPIVLFKILSNPGRPTQSSIINYSLIPPSHREPSPVKDPYPPPSPHPPPTEEAQEEAPFPLILEFTWQDFVPSDWDLEFLPSNCHYSYKSFEILFEKSPTPPPTILTPTPASPKRPVRKPVTTSAPAPVLKQAKFFCVTCQLVICNKCFAR